ncbi:uncharacterized protein A4U43_C07F16420 [Asparagus officinalis]|uniref:adenylate kinase n=1 Tax=Asparagus officinalis TaxID=4686 RepID=A0A5P1EHL5_ASPOF|nr:uncharacterized protein A4U43_C07F16420 [Asparagus officinalis]
MQSDAQENGWLLDGYPRSLSKAKALEDLGIRPDLFILLDVSEDILVERVVGRRLDPVTGRYTICSILQLKMKKLLRD